MAALRVAGVQPLSITFKKVPTIYLVVMCSIITISLGDLKNKDVVNDLFF